MVDASITTQIIEILLSKIEVKDQELGRMLIHDEFEDFDSRIVIWAIRENVRDLKETTITDLHEIADIGDLEIKVTYSPRSFFEDVLTGKNVPYWQVATVMRLLKNSDIVYDPKGKLEDWRKKAKYVVWQDEIIELKKSTSLMLIERMNNRISDDMLVDGYIWLIKAAEEAICVPLMIQNAFGVGTASLLLDTLHNAEINLYDFFRNLLRVNEFTPDKLEKARLELELLADKLYQKNIKTDREMWILAAFVSINESERRLNQSLKIKTSDVTSTVASRLFETAVGELWQAYFLVAQNPRSAVKLDPWVVASFWNWFGSPEIDEKWIKSKEKYIRDAILA
ncbi:MAG: hypothetical protein KAT16_10775 [Candidatus Heimdallarchaeota archaeon]|nr:hypothetical protein [Candidatus Heimdallarchaeota archaeon]